MIAAASTGTKQRVMSPVHAQGNPPRREPLSSQGGSKDLLADEKHVDRAEVEDIEEGKRGQTIVCRVLACVKLQRSSAFLGSDAEKRLDGVAHHNSLALVLDDMAGPTDFIATAEAEKLELIGWVDRLLAGCVGHCRGLTFGCHRGEPFLTRLGSQRGGRAAGQQQSTPGWHLCWST